MEHYKSYLDIHSVDFSSTDLWTPVTNVNFHSNENQIIYFKLGAKKTTGCHDSFLFEIKGLDLISMMSVNYNHQWKINSYTFYDDRRMCIVNCQNTIVHAQERIKPVIKKDKKDLETMKSIDLIIEESPKTVSDYKSGKISALGFLIGKFMKKHKAADANIIKKLIIEKLNETKN